MELPSLPDFGRRLRSAVMPAVRPRRMWARGNRAHIEVRGTRTVAHSELRRALEQAFERVEGVDWVAWNAALGHAVIAFDNQQIDPDALLDTVESVERALGVEGEPLSEEQRSFLDERESATRLLTELAVDGVALTASVWGALARLTPIPVELASAVQFVETQTPVREAIAHRIGNSATDVAFAVTNAFAQGLAQGPLSLVNDMVYRADLLGAVVVRDRASTRVLPDATSTRERATALHTDAGPRPQPRPVARTDRYLQRSGLASAAAGGALLLTGARQVAGGAFVAGIGKAGVTGRGAYRAELERTFLRRNIFLLDASVLRRFEQVDAVVIDGRSCDPMIAERAITLASSAGLRVVDVEEEADVLPIIRDLQRSGRVVATVSDSDAVLHAADVAVAVHRPDRVAWHADVVTPVTELPMVITGIAVAGANANRALALSVAGSGVAALLSVSGVRNGARAAATAVNIASLVAMGVGTWDARRVGGVRPDPRRLDEVRWHALDATRVLAELGSSLSGLDPEDARRRPHNSVDVDDADVVDIVAAELATPLTPVLSGGAGVSALLGSAMDAVLVGGVLVGNVALGVAQRLNTRRAVRKLEAQSDAPVRVVRGGREIDVAYEDLVAGDVIRLATGDVVPADARVLSEDNVLVDESGLTGESFAVRKDTNADGEETYVAERHSMLFAGTTIASGAIEAVVVAVGDDTEAARAQRVGGEHQRPTGVERRLADIARVTVPLSLGAGAVLTASSLLRGRPLRETVATGVGLVAAVLPEGLPIVATTAQLGAARRLSQHNAIVRAPRTIEALGRVDVLCFDKTGTLTEGAVRVQRVATRVRVERLDELSDDGREILQIALQASVVDGDNGDGGGNGSGAVHVHSADRALQGVAEELHLDRGSWTVAAELPFEHDRSYAAMRVIDGENIAVTVKGAPEVVLPRCTTWRARPSVQLDDAERARAEQQVEALASAGYRVLAIAQRDATPRPELEDEDLHDLELVGFIGFADAVRETAQEAVRAIERAGVNVVMITGDHPRTAEAVARELGALDGRQLLAGPELDAMHDDALDARVDEVAVYARVTPAHKARIVQALQRRNHVVAMTGDGTNDAAAIRLADVGVALGGRATPAARHAADVVVTDDRLETIVAALIEGRAMWGSVRDALSILLGGNLGELGYAVAIGLATGRSPLNARQTLLVNLLTDLLPAAAIAGRPPRHTSPEALLAGGPDAALGNALTEDVITRAIATAGGASAAWLTARFTGRQARANTIGLVALVETQLGQTLLTGGRSPLVVASTVISTGALVAVVQIPGVSQFFGCTPLGPVGWTIATTAAAGGTAASLALPWATRAIRSQIGSRSGEPRLYDLTKEELEDEERQLGEDHGEQFLHDDLRR